MITQKQKENSFILPAHPNPQVSIAQHQKGTPQLGSAPLTGKETVERVIRFPSLSRHHIKNSQWLHSTQKLEILSCIHVAGMTIVSRYLLYSLPISFYH